MKRFQKYDTKFQGGKRLVPNVLNGVIVKMPLHSSRIRAAGGGLDELIVMMRPHFGRAGRQHGENGFNNCENTQRRGPIIGKDGKANEAA